MFSYCLKWGKNIKNVDLKVSKTKNGRTLLLSTCTVCGSKNQDSWKNNKQNEY